ncbi:hypothetical protein CPB86DRAFT_782240 [Serendipita vermifera]|nr:hypothetical protein CPB86DRAFT_782240 [Serendipita vermifera]
MNLGDQPEASHNDGMQGQSLSTVIPGDERKSRDHKRESITLDTSQESLSLPIGQAQSTFNNEAHMGDSTMPPHITQHATEQNPQFICDITSPTNTNETNPVPRPRTIRFNSRVRITSGVGHSGRTKSPQKKDASDINDPRVEGIFGGSEALDIESRPTNGLNRSANSSLSGSYSSSISAPLRSSSDVPPKVSSARISSKHRKPLSNVLDSQDASAWLRRMELERRSRRRTRGRADNETTPLLGAHQSPPEDSADADYDLPNGHNHKYDSESQDGWSWKMFSIYYWEARISSLCCCESDIED